MHGFTLEHGFATGPGEPDTFKLEVWRPTGRAKWPAITAKVTLKLYVFHTISETSCISFVFQVQQDGQL
jgi:hypothetical protein